MDMNDRMLKLAAENERLRKMIPDIAKESFLKGARFIRLSGKIPSAPEIHDEANKLELLWEKQV